MLRNLIPSANRGLSRLGADPIVSLRRALDRVFEDFNGDFADLASDTLSEPMSSFAPRLDLEEKNDKIVLTAELPGMTDKHLQLRELSLDSKRKIGFFATKKKLLSHTTRWATH